MTARRTWWLLWAAFAAVGCAPEIPDATYRCDADADCPPEQACGADGLCYRDVPCAPETCESRRAFCGAIGDGCGGMLDCGDCTLPETCGGDGIPNLCGCRPMACAPEQCGSFDNGCGLMVDCGGCPAGQACIDGECGCTPMGCNNRCGQVLDCGMMIDCGGCPAGETCGAVDPNMCGVGTCEPDTCDDLGATCGTPSDGCSMLLDCGTCVPPEECDELVANQCGCRPTTCEREGAECGSLLDGCGGTLDCEPCPGGQLCGSDNRCECQTECAPDSCDADGCSGCGSCGSAGGCDEGHCVCDDDEFEFNGSLAAAAIGDVIPTGTIQVKAVVSNPGDHDWYYWRVSESNEPATTGSFSVGVKLSGIGASDNYDLEVLIACVDGGGGATETHTCDGSAPVAAMPYPGCLSSTRADADETVQLSLNVTPGCQPTGFYIHVIPVTVAPRCVPYQLDVVFEYSADSVGA